MEVLNELATASIVLGFAGGVFSFAVLRPLNKAIIELQCAAKDLRADIRASEERRHELELKVAEIDQRARSAHHRLDDLTEFCRKTHSSFPKRRRDRDESHSEGPEQR